MVNIAVNDLGASAAKKYDCEAWLPSQGRYRELTSCSNTTDYQARRLDDPLPADGREASRESLHTLNGTAVAVGRTIDRAAGERPAGRRLDRDPGGARRGGRAGAPARRDWLSAATRLTI